MKEVVSEDAVGAVAAVDTSEEKDGAHSGTGETDSHGEQPGVDSSEAQDSADTVGSTPPSDVRMDSSTALTDVERGDGAVASDLWSEIGDWESVDGEVIEDSGETGNNRADVAIAEDSGGDMGGVDIVISECGKLVSPGALSGKDFSSCMGFPLIEQADAIAITPIPATCPSPPVVAEVSNPTSISLKSWYYINPPGWEPDDWAGAEPGGIQQIIAIEDDVVMVAGTGGLNGDFFQSPARAVFGLVSRMKGVTGAAQSDPIPGTYALFRLNRLPDDTIALVAAGVAKHRLLLTLDAGLMGGIAQTPFSFHYVYSVTKGLGSELIVAGVGPIADECDTQRVARLGLDATLTGLNPMGGAGYESELERHIVPLGGCGYGYIVPANIFVGSTSLLPVIIRMDENLNVVGLWRWNVPAPNFGYVGEGIHAATVDGDVVIATRLWVMRVDGTTGDVKWYTKLTLPAGYPSLIAGLTVLPGGRTVVSLEVSKSGPPKGKVYAILTVIGLDGCIEKHFTLEGIEYAPDEPIWRLEHIVAVGDEAIAGTTVGYGKPVRSEVLFVDLPGAQQ